MMKIKQAYDRLTERRDDVVYSWWGKALTILAVLFVTGVFIGILLHH